MEFYQKDRPKRRHRCAGFGRENTLSTNVQQRFIEDQEQEKKRVNARFDEDLVKLEKFWALSGNKAAADPARAGASRPVMLRGGLSRFSSAAVRSPAAGWLCPCSLS